MASSSSSWRNELIKYFHAVEQLTEKALLLIKQDRIQNHLPFDESFKAYFLDRTKSRIANVYVDLMYEERFEEESIQQSYGTSTQHPLVSTIIGPESLEQMPIILIQSSNENFVRNTSASSTFAQNGNQMSEQIINPIPSNQTQSDPSGVENCRSFVAKEPKGRSEIMAKATIESNPSKGNEKVTAVTSELAMASASASADRVRSDRPLRKAVTSPIHQHQPETIDLTSDQEDAPDILDSDQNIERQTLSNDRQRKAINSKQMERVKLFLHGGKQQSIGFIDISNHMANNKKVEATSNDNLDPSSASETSVISPVKDQLELVVLLSSMNRDTNFDKMSSDETNGRDSRQDDGFASATVEGISNEQNPESIDTTSDQEDAAMNRDGNGVSRNAGNFAKSLQPTAHRRKRGNVNATIGGHFGGNLKLASTVETKKRHNCDYCDYSARQKGDLTRHIRMHTNERPYECTICQKRFTQQQNLNTHMKTHRDLFQFECSNCRQGFSDEIKWKSHQSRCKVKGFECHLCKKIFLRKHQLVDHMRAHTGEKLRCSMCRKRFNSNNGLKFHMKSHGKQFRFQCSNCRQGFALESVWKSHESRCKSKQFECFLCGRKFHHEKGSLLRHMRRKHTGEKPFGCSDCPKRFCRKSN